MVREALNLPHDSAKSTAKNTANGDHGRSESEIAEPGAPIFDDTLRPLIPPGEYTVVCMKAGKYRDVRYKREEIVLDFRIAEGDFVGKHLQRFHAFRRLVTRGSVYLREWVIANNGDMPRRRDRLAPSKFEGKLFKVRVETVVKAWDGLEHPPSLRYSKIGAILELLVTNEVIQ